MGTSIKPLMKANQAVDESVGGDHTRRPPQSDRVPSPRLILSRVAMVSQRAAVVQVRSGMWQPAAMLCAHGAVVCSVVQMWLVWCRACMHGG